MPATNQRFASVVISAFVGVATWPSDVRAEDITTTYEAMTREDLEDAKPSLVGPGLVIGGGGAIFLLGLAAIIAGVVSEGGSCAGPPTGCVDSTSGATEGGAALMAIGGSAAIAGGFWLHERLGTHARIDAEIRSRDQPTATGSGVSVRWGTVPLPAGLGAGVAGVF